jgi:adsorption protein B
LDQGLTVAAVAGHLLLGEVVAVTALLLAISAIDDLFVDLAFIGRTAWLARRRTPRLQLAQLRAVEPAPMAIIIPAWDEAAVIGAMLARLLATLDYPCYRVFVGLYRNDPAGIAAVAALTDARLQPVLCRRPGPTTKADCLNHLWHAIEADEIATGRRFKAIVLHDAEDVVHPQELRVQNALIPQLAMVQLPVIPLVDGGSRWVAGHYLDEFANNHIKDVIVRAMLGAAVPSAGVACAIEREMLGRIAAAAGGDPFDPACLTEDYELGLRIKALGGGTALVRVPCPDGSGVIATREHFPATFATARRQKTRWLLGIALSGWDRLGWPGGLADRYMLVRDRKAVAAALLTMFAHVLTLFILIDLALVTLVPTLTGLPPLFGPLAATLVAINIVLLAWRLAMRAACTGHQHGWREGLRALPRALVSNVINAAAAWSACWRYAGAMRTGAPFGWDKTAHRFPAPGAA